MGVFVFIFLALLFFQKRYNSCYTLLVLMQIASIGMGGFVGHYIQFDTLKTFFNICFVFVNIYLIVSPWRFARFEEIIINNRSSYYLTEKILDYTLRIVLIVNIIVFVAVLLFVPDIAQFKNELGFKELYDSLPYFSSIFRICAMTQYLGYFALPICTYYLQVGDKKKCIRFFILSLSSLVGALALYSRAGMVTFTLTSLSYLLLVLSVFDSKLQKRIKKYIKIGTVAIAAIFLTITVIRFSAMPWYEDRIPKDSMIQDPIAYNIFDYASQGFTNGINQLEVHSNADVLNGEGSLYLFYQTLAYFHIINWSSESAQERWAKAYDKNGLIGENDPGAFHGYTCRLVKDFGYLLTLLICVLYYGFIRRKMKHRNIDLISLFFIILLLIQPCVSIFYATYGEILFPYLFMALMLFLGRFRIKQRKIKGDYVK